MLEGLLGRKIGMTQVFDSQGGIVPVTVVQAGPCVVLGKKMMVKDAYNAIQLGFGQKREKNLNKCRKGFYAKANQKPVEIIKEFKTDAVDTYNVGQEIKLDIFQVGDYVDVTGISKGKGYAGVIKRCGYTGGRSTHGSMFHRKPGSIGASSFPSRVLKGLGLPGQMGNVQRTTIKLEIVDIDSANNLMLIKGAIPGNNKGLVMIKKTTKALKHKKEVVKAKSTDQKLVKKPSKKKLV
ncbi:MAG: 50S ribosomal protein L3 [bacterium]|nr:50S ribosomal protein L3 [bacterium]MDD5354634.1 50S ribosomal protein L3 [bacterium]MDD5756469.1 50S ribosomal protein L3 [bacterium]